MKPEQSKPTVPAPDSMPVDGPVGLPPPQEYGTPICVPPRRMTYSMACGPRTRPGATPAGAPPMPMLDRNLRPRSMVAWVACAVAASDALAMASGSPGAPALSTWGRVGSHCPPSGSAWAGMASPIASRIDTNAVNRVRWYRNSL